MGIINNWLKGLFSSPSPTAIEPQAPHRRVPDGFRPTEFLIRVDREAGPGSPEDEMVSSSHPSRQGKDEMVSSSHPSRQGKNDLTDERVAVLIKKFTRTEVAEMGGRLTDRTLARWGLARGWIVADGKEMKAIGADPQTQDLQREGPLVGCGTIVPHDGDAYVWAVGGRSDTGEPYLVSIFGLGDYRLYCHAFVRKAPA